MAERHIRANRFSDELVRRLKADTNVLRAAALDTAERAEAEAVRDTDATGLVDLGQFKLSWVHTRVLDGAQIGNTSPHSAALEHGRRPGRPGPPFAPIREWVARKLVPNGVILSPTGGAPTEADIDQAAWAIRNAIHTRGSRPHLILKGLEPRIRRWFRQEALRRLRDKSRR